MSANFLRSSPKTSKQIGHSLEGAELGAACLGSSSVESLPLEPLRDRLRERLWPRRDADSSGGGSTADGDGGFGGTDVGAASAASAGTAVGVSSIGSTSSNVGVSCAACARFCSAASLASSSANCRRASSSCRCTF